MICAAWMSLTACVQAGLFSVRSSFSKEGSRVQTDRLRRTLAQQWNGKQARPSQALSLCLDSVRMLHRPGCGLSVGTAHRRESRQPCGRGGSLTDIGKVDGPWLECGCK